MGAGSRRVVHNLQLYKDESGGETVGLGSRETFDHYYQQDELKNALAKLSPDERAVANWAQGFLKTTDNLENIWDAQHGNEDNKKDGVDQAVGKILKLINEGKDLTHVIPPLTFAIKEHERAVM